MRSWVGWILLVGCNGKSDDAGDGDGDADTDTDTDGDADTDADTDQPTAPLPLECPAGPCDSDPTGSWNILGACVDDPRFAEIEAECPGNTVTLYGVGIDGTMSFNATDYTFYVNGGNTGIGIVVPPECNTGCLNYELPDLGVRCTTTGLGGCDCTGSTGTSTWLDSGTWTRSGSTLTLESAATGGSRTIEVCATGDVIWFYDPNRDVSVAGVPTPEVPMRASILSLLVATACSEQTVGVHNSVPSVVITSHREGDLVLDGVATEFRAQAGDADGPSEELNATWYAGGALACAASHPDETGLTVCEAILTAELEPEIRVEISDAQGDGAFDEVLLEVAPFEAPPSDAPIVTWVAPDDGGASPAGLVTFEITVEDTEDLPTDLALEYTSSLDGAFSTQGADSAGRATFAYDGLSEGTHVLTVRATDAAGLWTEDVIVHTIEPVAVVPDYDGIFTIEPAIHYDCQETFFNSTVVDFDIASFVFSVVGNELTVSGAPPTMSQQPDPIDENFSVQGVINGGCDETYILAGAFSDDDTWSGNFQVSFTGGQCGATNCTNQVWAVEGTRQ